MSAISLVAGLGNPGNTYEPTRHNAGFWFLDALTRRLALSWRSESRFSTELADTRIQNARLRVLRPTTFMNESGTPVASIAEYFEIPAEHILVVHDDLDLPPGTVRVKRGGGHGGHNGLRDLCQTRIAGLRQTAHWCGTSRGRGSGNGLGIDPPERGGPQGYRGRKR